VIRNLILFNESRWQAYDYLTDIDFYKMVIREASLKFGPYS